MPRRKPNPILTPSQYRVLETITVLLEHEYSPTIQEISDAAEISTSRAHQLVIDLRHAGYLRRAKKRAKYKIDLSDRGSEKMARFCIERFKKENGI